MAAKFQIGPNERPRSKLRQTAAARGGKREPENGWQPSCRLRPAAALPPPPAPRYLGLLVRHCVFSPTSLRHKDREGAGLMGEGRPVRAPGGSRSRARTMIKGNVRVPATRPRTRLGARQQREAGRVAGGGARRAPRRTSTRDSPRTTPITSGMDRAPSPSLGGMAGRAEGGMSPCTIAESAGCICTSPCFVGPDTQVVDPVLFPVLNARSRTPPISGSEEGSRPESPLSIPSTDAT